MNILTTPSLLPAVIKVGGVNSTVDESEGSVDVCLTMDKEAEIPISVDLNFSGNVDSEMVPAQGWNIHDIVHVF